MNILMIKNLRDNCYGVKCICDISNPRPNAYINYISTGYHQWFVEIASTTTRTNDGGQGRAKHAARRRVQMALRSLLLS